MSAKGQSSRLDIFAFSVLPTINSIIHFHFISFSLFYVHHLTVRRFRNSKHSPFGKRWTVLDVQSGRRELQNIRLRWTSRDCILTNQRSTS